MKFPWLSGVLVLGLTIAVRSKEAESNHLQEINHSKGRAQRADLAAANDVANAAASAVADAAGQVTNTVSQVVAGTPLADPFSAFLLKIGNVLGFLDNIDLTNANLGPIDLTGIDLANLGIGTGAVGAAGGAAAVATTLLAGISTMKTALLTIGLKGLEIANFVLAIIGLAMLGAFLYSTDGDIKALYGTGTGTGFADYSAGDYAYDSYSNYISSARSLMETPLVQQLADAVYEAITKYDN